MRAVEYLEAVCIMEAHLETNFNAAVGVLSILTLHMRNKYAFMNG